MTHLTSLDFFMLHMIEKSLHAKRQGKNSGFKIDIFVELCVLDSEHDIPISCLNYI